MSVNTKAIEDASAYVAEKILTFHATGEAAIAWCRDAETRWRLNAVERALLPIYVGRVLGTLAS